MEDIVMVPVPRRHLGAVYRVIGEGEADVEPAPEPQPTPQPTLGAVSDPAAGDSDNGDWSPNEIARLYRESPPVMVKFLGYLADHPGEEVTAPDLAEFIYGSEDKRRQRKLPGALGAFGRRVKNRYRKGTWPFRGYWSYENSVFTYKMDTWSAEQVRKARGDG